MNDYKHIAVKESPGRIDLFLKRPPLNILNIEMMKEINLVLEEIISRTDIKVVVFRSEEKAFSAGVDVGEHTADKVEEMMDIFGRMFQLLDQVKGVTIAAVKGAALGGGCELATFCDIILATDKAKFGQPEIVVGVYAPIAVAIFPRLIGRHRALELLITGDTISGEEAYRIGLANHVFPFDQFDQMLEDFLAKILNKSAAIIAVTKQVVDQGLYSSVPSAIEIAEEHYMNELMNTKDAHEGLNAFLEKRPPNWSNK